MKRLFGILLAFCMFLMSFATIAVAAEEISTFGITMNGFQGGATKEDVTFTLSDDRLELKEVVWVGTTNENGTFKKEKIYHITLHIKIKSGLDVKFTDEIPAENLQYTGINQAVASVMQPTKKQVRLNFQVKLSKKGEFLSEAEEEAMKHKHCYCGGYIEIGDHTTHETVTYQKWTGENKIPYNSEGVAYVYLENDIELESTLNVGGRKTLYLCLNGHAISMKYRGHRVVNVDVGGELLLCNCTRSEGGKLTNGEEEYGAGIHNNGTVKMYGGLITKNNGGYGGGVYNNANFTLYGGDIYDNKALYGGGVWNDNENDYKFVMYEGTISFNMGTGAGGGIYNNDHANLVLKGGTINLNVGPYGGGVWNNGGNVELDGSMLLENTAKCGGGVWNNGGGIFEFKSGNISKNLGTSDPENMNGRGGGIWNNETGVINMTGGEITFNRSAEGGGVWCNPNSEFMMSGGVIAENNADYGGGIYISTDEARSAPARFRITNQAGVVLNVAEILGGGAYVEGILELEGEGEVTGNISGTPDNINIYAIEGAQVNQNNAMPTQFVDVAPDSYFLEPVKWALDKGITTGTSDITFSPDDTCNTAQILTFLWRAAGSPAVTKMFPFADVKESDYFYMAAQWAKANDIVEHYALYPNFSSSRMASVYYIWCAAGKPECKTPLSFTDTQDPKYEKYYEAIAWAVEQGITNGTSDTTFSPGKTCTRAQIVTFLWRAAQKGLL